MFGTLFQKPFARPPRIRPASAREVGFVSAVAKETLGSFGHYDQLLPEWMRQPGIHTYVAELDSRLAGLCMFGFFDDPERGLFADLLAIAVAPGFQKRGLGRALLRFVIDQSRRRGTNVTELRLSVADTNDRARALFQAEGFTPRPYEIGTYDRGQLALRMALDLSAASDTRAA